MLIVQEKFCDMIHLHKKFGKLMLIVMEGKTND
jgi:hypothetical protein